MTVLSLLAVEFTGKIGVGTLLTFGLIIATGVALYLKWQQGDPSEWRANYLGEVTRREEEVTRREKVEADLRDALQENAVMKARTNLEPVLSTLSKVSASLTTLEENQRQTAELLAKVANTLEINGHQPRIRRTS